MSTIKKTYLSSKRASGISVELLMRKVKGRCLRVIPLKKTWKVLWQRAE